MPKTSLLALLLVGAACSQRVYAPPSRAFALDSARTLDPGGASVGAQGGAQGAIFGPTIGALEGQVRYGLAPDVEVSGGMTYATVGDDSKHDTDPRMYLGRAGVKINPDRGVAALTGGVGGGYAGAGGAFVAGDLGMILAYEGCHVIPFVAASGFLSQPLDPHPVDVTMPDDPMTVLDTPSTTYGFTTSTGLKLAARDHGCDSASPFSMTLAVATTRVADHDSHDGFVGAALGVEASF